MTLIESFSGIRGIYGEDLTDDIASRYAYIYSEYLHQNNLHPKIVVGMDTRTSGPNLKSSMIEGVKCNIIDVDVLPTAAIENAVRAFNCAGGIIITGSHNEPHHNGIKFLDKDGAVLRPKDIDWIINEYQKIKNLSEEKFLSGYLFNKQTDHAKIVEKRHSEALHYYKKFILKFFKSKDRKLLASTNVKILIDPNGGAGIFAKNIFLEFGIKAKYVNMEQGKFVRSIEPNLKALKSLKIGNCEFGAGFDCDADRVEIITKSGELISGNQIMAIIADEILGNLKNPEEETVVVNDATSYLVKEIISEYNSKWKEVEVGEINVVDAMVGFNSPIGGEGSNGGIIIPPSRCRDGILTLLFLILIVARKKKSLKKLVEDLPEYTYVKEKVKLKRNFTKIRSRIMTYFLDKGYLVEETGDETGGIKAIKDNSWIWFRQSKTEDKVLRIIVDSKDIKKAKELLQVGRKIL